MARCATGRSVSRRCWLPLRRWSRRPTTSSPSAGRAPARRDLRLAHPGEGLEVLKAIREAIEVGERSGVPVEITHLKIAEKTLWGRMAEIIALIEAARSRGVDVQANVYRTPGGTMTW